ncbi:MAG: hypothetical protein DCC58_03690 [Chloroflexi bacterium]|nr:MAG: hypothetical protein DCC58_03690 [Chloroflexota bacterium]
MTMIFLLSSQERVPATPVFSAQVMAYVAHFVMFGVLAGLFCVALAGSQLSIRACVSAVALALCYAIFDEIHQAFVPGRDASVSDVIVDLAGALSGAFGWYWVHRRSRMVITSCK